MALYQSYTFNRGYLLRVFGPAKYDGLLVRKLKALRAMIRGDPIAKH